MNSAGYLFAVIAGWSVLAEAFLRTQGFGKKRADSLQQTADSSRYAAVKEVEKVRAEKGVGIRASGFGLHDSGFGIRGEEPQDHKTQGRGQRRSVKCRVLCEEKSQQPKGEIAASARWSSSQ